MGNNINIKKINWKKLLLSILLTQGAGGIGAIATTPKIVSWYVTLNKPTFNPPNWLFGPVWTLLFLMMGVAFYLVWMEGKKAYGALKIFGLQLGLNVLWSFLFFGAESPGLALLEIVFLWLAILATIISFQKISKTAMWLMIPYLGWVSFASVLNGAIYWLNK